MQRTNKVKSEEAAVYLAACQSDNDIVSRALEILAKRVKCSDILTSPKTTRDYLIMRISGTPHELFGCLWLNTQHGVIACEEIFRGTIDGASVYPREIVKEALQHNAAAVIFYHNHPSGNPEPSSADITLTRKLKTALELVDILVLDHFVVAGDQAVSFAERGLL